LEIPDHFPSAELDEFIIMPNHIHGILSVTEDDSFLESERQTHMVKATSLGTIVRSYKSAVSKRINLRRNTPGDSIWQRNYYESIVTSSTDLVKIREYIARNPDNWQKDDYYSNN